MLFRLEAEFKLHHRVMLSINFDTDLKKHVRTTEFDVLPDILGSTTITSLQASYDAASGVESAMSTPWKGLLPFVQDVIAPFAYAKFLPSANGMAGQSGLMVPAEGQTASAPKWMYEEQMLAAEAAGWEAVEHLYKYLEANKATFTAWAASDQYSEFKGGFIFNAKTFDDCVKIGKSCRTFVAVKPKMANIEQWAILPVLGQTLFDQIKAQIKANTVSADNAVILPLIREAVANLTMASAFDSLNMKVDGRGITVYEASTGNESSSRIQAQMAERKEYKKNLKDTGEAILNRLAKYLNDNASTYPLFQASDAYKPDDDDVFRNAAGSRTSFLM